ncbi:MAG: hypothetical protein IPJ86_15190 [Bacteroidetes bacterium]|nr:hypothetical protein [Bacteroidota bacterium]
MTRYTFSKPFYSALSTSLVFLKILFEDPRTCWWLYTVDIQWIYSGDRGEMQWRCGVGAGSTVEVRCEP